MRSVHTIHILSIPLPLDGITVKLYDTGKRYNTVLHESAYIMRIIAIANQKGGVGKTPTTVNMAFALARSGYTVLLVDLDPQGSLSEYFLADQADIQEVTVYNALSDLQRIEPLSLTKQIALLPAHDELAGAELELPSKVHGQKRLAKVLSFYQTDYDFCLLDCPPSLGILTINALASAHQVVIPVKTEISAERALKRIKNTIKDIQESDLNGQLTVWGILPTIYDSRKAHHKEVLEALRFKYGSEVYKEPSRETTKYNDATVLKADVSTLDKALGAYWDTLAASLVEGGKVK
jgi:chromosome partitioning protein